MIRSRDRPAQRQAAALAWEPADHLGAPANLSERALEQVRAPPLAPVSQRIAQVDQERVEVFGKARGRGRVPGLVELADQHSHPPLTLGDRLGLVEHLPVGGADPLAFALGQLRQYVAESMHGAALTVSLRPTLLDRADQSGRSVGDDQLRTRQPTACEVAAERPTQREQQRRSHSGDRTRCALSIKRLSAAHSSRCPFGLHVAVSARGNVGDETAAQERGCRTKGFCPECLTQFRYAAELHRESS